MLARLLAQWRARWRGAPRIPGALAGVADAVQRINAGQQAEREGRLGDALENYEEGLEEFPESAELNAMHGNVLRAMGRPDEAVAAYRKACELKPGLVAAWYNLALTEHGLGRAVTAEEAYREALRLAPDFSRGYSSLLCLIGMGQAGGRQRTPQEVLGEHRAWAARYADPLQKDLKPAANSREPGRRLRIGYVSADLRYHAIACFVEPILEHHDRAGFEILCYDNSETDDGTKRRLRGLADGWRPIAAMEDAAVAELIREDRIDLLVDLGGHTEGNRLLVFARKPAPLQITYLGYPNSTGLSAMDYRLTDFAADPPGTSEDCYAERLLRLPHSMWCYRPFDDMPEVQPREAGDAVVFGSMNGCSKLSGEILALWARLLREVPASRLLLAAVPPGSAQQRLRETFTREGIAAERIECAPWLDNAEFWKLHHRIDVALDSYPMNGGTTTCESLWMGVPVVTLKGSTFGSRAGCSLLTAAGFPQWITDSPAEFLQTAAALARDADGRASLRQGMRDALRHSALMDAAGFTRDLEALYREAWRAWCASGG
jgi:protein O-GlcNAc transferase